MGNGYTRQSSGEILDSQVIEASDFNDEFNAIQDAFNSTLGHTHDGTVGEGPKISLTSSITGVLPAVNGGIGGIHNLTATSNPGSTNDTNSGYAIGSIWVNNDTNNIFACADATASSAVWRHLTHDQYTNADNLTSGTVAVDRLSGTYNIDISGDADTLDGQEGSYYEDISARLGYTPLDEAGGIITGDIDPPTGTPSAVNLGNASRVFSKIYSDEFRNADNNQVLQLLGRELYPDPTTYTTTSTSTYGASGSYLANEVTPSSSTSRLQLEFSCYIKVTSQSAGTSARVRARPEYFNGTSWVAILSGNGGYGNIYGTVGYDNGSGTVIRYFQVVSSLDIPNSYKRTDTGDWLVRMKFDVIDSGSTADMGSASTIITEYEPI